VATAKPATSKGGEEYHIFIDTGGTFSDCIILKQDGTFVRGKSPTTPRDLSDGFFGAIEAACTPLGKPVREVLKNTKVFGYGTTQGTNIVITGTGARNLGFITTRGHEDRTLIGRLRPAGLSRQEAMHVPRAFMPAPLIPRKRIKGVIERMDGRGKVVIPLREDSVRQAVRELLDAGVEGITVGLIWSFMNPAHERRIAEIIEEMAPGMPVSISSTVAPIIREYPRFMTSIIELYIGKALKQLLVKIGTRLKESGYANPLLVLQAAGGLARAETVRPVTTLHSGPVGGFAGVEFMKGLYGWENAVGADVGGTSFDVCVSPKGRIDFLREPIVGRFEICNPMREIVTIGAGGGTMSRVEKAVQLLIVGPESAGSDPGPVCYGRGGTVPTSTDADVVMNRIDPDYFLGGRMKLDRGKAFQAIKEKIADPLGMDVYDAAEGMCKILDANMGTTLYSSVVIKGLAPAECGLVIYGGAGPSHCAGFTAGLKFKEVVIPPFAGVFCAFGASTSDIMHRYEASPFVNAVGIPFDSETLEFRFDKLNSLDDIKHEGIDRFNRMFSELEEHGRADMLAEGIGEGAYRFDYEILARYGGQLWELRTRIPIGRIGSLQDMEKIVKAFEKRYYEEYGRQAMAPRGGVQIITIAVTPVAPTVKPKFIEMKEVGEDPGQALRGERDVYFEGAFRKSRIYSMEKLLPGNVVQGPAVIDGIDTNIIIPMDRFVQVDRYNNFILKYK